MIKNLKLFLLVVFQGYFFCGYPQNLHLQFDHIGTASGLSISNVQSIVQDSRGFMWFGTTNGLNKYDGYRFTVYKNDPADSNSLTNNYLRSIAKSKNGDLWVATLGGGVCRYNHNKEHFERYRHNPKNINSITDDNVNAVLEDEEGNVWIGTSTGLDMLEQKTKKFEHFLSLKDNKNTLSVNNVKNIFEDCKHNLWIATVNGGINLFNRKYKHLHVLCMMKKIRLLFQATISLPFLKTVKCVYG